MNDNVCFACSSALLENAYFCFNCGIQVRCKSCQELLPEEANNCVYCGEVATKPKQAAVNTIKLRESKDERVYEIEFTNEVGKEMKEVVADLLKNRLGSATDKNLVSAGFYVSSGEEGNKESGPVNPQAYPKAETPVQTISVNKSPVVLDEELPYPHLNDLEMKLQCKENEWLLLFAFYKSDFGTTTFTKDTVWQVYKDKRKTETRFKNLGTNWKTLFKKYISTVKENEFKLTTEGLSKVKSLLQPTTDDAKSKTLVRKGQNPNSLKPGTTRSLPVSRKTHTNSISPDEFDVYQNDYKESLESFFKRKKPGNGNPNRIVTIAYYITKINHQDYFTEGNIDYAYRILNLAGKPVHLKQIIINLKNERIWFQKTIDQRITGWKLTRQAEIYVEEKLPALF